MIVNGIIPEDYNIMNCTTPILTIDVQDCIGDSLGKHNYNALNLDTSVCNLSSLIYNGTVNVKSVFNTLSSLMNAYSDLIAKYDENKLYHISTASTTVNLLSSFWGNYEFSVQYPTNVISLAGENLPIIAPTITDVNLVNVDAVANNRLKTLANIYLNEKYPATYYNSNTVINVIFFLYNIVPNITDATINDSITVVKTTNASGAISNTFSYNNRVLYADYTRDNVYLKTGVILKYYNSDSKWNYIGYVVDDTIANAPANTNTTAIKPPTDSSTVITNQANITAECRPVKANTYYPTSNYNYTKGVIAGRSKKLGTVNLTFRTKSHKTSVFSYKATGYNATTNTGGYDAYLEFDSSENTIKAYEEYPTPKTLKQTWNYPYSSETGVNFKYTYKGGVSFNTCFVPKAGV
jgi:hypothetical protein